MSLCKCGRVTNPGGAWVTGDCRKCWLQLDQSHLGISHRAQGHTEPPAPIHRPRQCIYLGSMVERTASCTGKCWHFCDAGHGVEGRTRPGIECQTCEYHETDRPEIKLRLDDYRQIDQNVSPRWEFWSALLGGKRERAKLKPLPADVEDWAIPFAGRVVIAPFAAHGPEAKHRSLIHCWKSKCKKSR